MTIRTLWLGRILGAALALLLTLPTRPIDAATISVTTKADIVANDGLCSLREAIDAANRNLPSGGATGECVAGDPVPTIDTVRLPKGKFKLTLGNRGEDLNAEGDLDVMESVVIEGAGSRKTTIENAIGTRQTPDDGDRLIHVDPTQADDVDITLRRLGLRRGEASCTGNTCAAKASALEAEGSGGVLLDDCYIAKNSVRCSGQNCGSLAHGAAVRALRSLAVVLLDTIIEKNEGRCTGTRCKTGAAGIFVGTNGRAGAIFDMSHSRIAKNATRCDGQGCDASSILKVFADTIHVDDSSFERNRVECLGSQCNAERMFVLSGRFDVTMEGGTVGRNILGCVGEGCEAELGLELLSHPGDIVLQAVALSKNRARCTGDACDAGVFAKLNGGDTLVASVDVDRNTAACSGINCEAESFLFANGRTQTTVRDTRLSRNVARCQGDGCDASRILTAHPAAVTLERVSATRNRLSSKGFNSEAGRVIQISATDALLDTVALQRNRSECTGTACGARTALGVGTGTLVVRNAALLGNRMSCKGATCSARSALGLSAASASLTGGTLVGNAAVCRGVDCTTPHGGALGNEAALLEVSDSTFVDNTASIDGGAITNVAEEGDAASLVLTRTVLQGNHAGHRGGAITNLGGAEPDDRATLVVIESELSGNSAGIDAGGIANAGDVLEITADSTVAGNAPNDCVNIGAGTGCP